MTTRCRSSPLIMTKGSKIVGARLRFFDCPRNDALTTGAAGILFAFFKRLLLRGGGLAKNNSRASGIVVVHSSQDDRSRSSNPMNKIEGQGSDDDGIHCASSASNDGGSAQSVFTIVFEKFRRLDVERDHLTSYSVCNDDKRGTLSSTVFLRGKGRALQRGFGLADRKVRTHIASQGRNTCGEHWVGRRAAGRREDAGQRRRRTFGASTCDHGIACQDVPDQSIHHTRSWLVDSLSCRS